MIKIIYIQLTVLTLPKSSYSIHIFYTYYVYIYIPDEPESDNDRYTNRQYLHMASAFLNVHLVLIWRFVRTECSKRAQSHGILHNYVIYKILLKLCIMYSAACLRGDLGINPPHWSFFCSI